MGGLLDEIVLNAANKFNGEFTIADIRESIGVSFRPQHNTIIRSILERSNEYACKFSRDSGVQKNVYIKQEIPGGHATTEELSVELGIPRNKSKAIDARVERLAGNDLKPRP